MGRATSVSADTDILVVPALVRSDRGKHVERCQKGELPDQQNFWREMKKISSLEVASAAAWLSWVDDVDSTIEPRRACDRRLTRAMLEMHPRWLNKNVHLEHG